MKHILLNNLASKQSGNEIWSVHAILQNKLFYQKTLSKLWPGNQFLVLFNFQRILSKKDSPKITMLIWTNFDSFAFFFSIWVFFHEHSRFTGQQGNGEAIFVTPLYQFHPLHRHLNITGVITTGSSSLHIASSRTRTGNLWFLSSCR